MPKACAVCGVHATKTKRCSRCRNAYYCSQEHQVADWPTHKLICLPHQAPVAKAPVVEMPTVVPNPWYAPVSPKTPAPLPIHVDSEACLAAYNGDLQALQTYITGDHALVNTTRDRNGETLLFCAIIGGHPDAVRYLLDGGATVNATEWRDNTPLYYAATHPGQNNVLRNNEELRCQIIQILLDSGADTMRQGGFSGKRPFEQAQALGHRKAALLIENEPSRALFCQVRNHINSPSAPEELRKLIEGYRDVYWRLETATWLILPNRHNMGQCFNPMPELVRSAPDLASVEVIFRDINQRHKAWFTLLRAQAGW